MPGGEEYALGTHYLGRFGVAGVPTRLWKALAFAAGRREFADLFAVKAQGDEEEEEGEEEEEEKEPMEIGLDEVEALLSFANRKLSAMQDKSENVRNILSAHSHDFPAVCGYIECYRRGQEEILGALIEELEAMCEGDEEEEEEESR